MERRAPYITTPRQMAETIEDLNEKLHAARTGLLRIIRMGGRQGMEAQHILADIVSLLSAAKTAAMSERTETAMVIRRRV